MTSLTLSTSLHERFDESLTAHMNEILALLSRIEAKGKGILQHHQVVAESSNGNFVLELDFEPFNASFPRPNLNKSIGNGVDFLNCHLSAKHFHGKESLQPLLEFLRLHKYNGKKLFTQLMRSHVYHQISTQLFGSTVISLINYISYGEKFW